MKICRICKVCVTGFCACGVLAEGLEPLLASKHPQVAIAGHIKKHPPDEHNHPEQAMEEPIGQQMGQLPSRNTTRLPRPILVSQQYDHQPQLQTRSCIIKIYPLAKSLA